MDYLKVTNSEIMEYFLNRIKSDERFKNLTTSSIFGMYMEMMSGVTDLLRHYITRQAEETYFDSSRLDSSAIKLSRNLFYNPVRARPADSEISITIKGPLPQQFIRNYTKTNDALKYKPTIYFNQYNTNLKYNGNNYLLKHTYSYTLTEEDIKECSNPNWSKTITLSRDFASRSMPLTSDRISEKLTKAIEVFQGEYRTKVFEGAYNGDLIAKPYQYLDIDDPEFSNWFGDRDPHAYTVEGTVATLKPENGYTKVGIGKNEDEAFSDDNLFEINNTSVFTSFRYRNAVTYDKLDQNNKLKVCTIYTKPDKTVRVKFGDNKYVSGGFNSTTDNIYVRYVATKGSVVNEIGTKDCMLKSEDKFYINVDGGLIDVTNNIVFKFTKDITSGSLIEDAENIKENASSYYASADRFVNSQDYEVGLRLSRALPRICGAKVWGEGEVENETGELNKYLQNLIFYTIIGGIYKNNNGRYEVKNMYTEGNDFTTLYSNGITNHLVDYIKSYKATSTFRYDQDYGNNESYINVIRNLNSYLNLKSFMNTRCYSIPPILQYFDLVGTVYINRLTNVADFQERLENKIYKWLDDNATFNTKIYLSDFYGLIKEEKSDVENCVIDLVSSGLLKGDDTVDSFVLTNDNNEDNIIRKQFSYKTRDLNDDEENVRKTIGTLTISKYQINHTLEVYDLKDKYITIILKGEDGKEIFSYYGQCENVNNYNEDNLKLTLPNIDNLKVLSDEEIEAIHSMELKFNDEGDYYSTSNFGTSNRALASYGLNGVEVNKVQGILNTWIKELSESNGSMDTPVPLPYVMDINVGEEENKIIYEETMRRAGNNTYDTLRNTLTEKSFNVYFIGSVLDSIAGNGDGEKNYRNINWKNVNALIRDIYPLLKPYICTNILDDNHNIVNYSMQQEIPVVRIKLNYRFV